MSPSKNWTDTVYGVVRDRLSLVSYVVDDSRALFLLQDGSEAFEVKDLLVQEDRCQEVTIDNRPYYGKGALVRRRR